MERYLGCLRGRRELKKAQSFNRVSSMAVGRGGAKKLRCLYD